MKTTTVQVSQATGIVLDYLVAKCEEMLGLDNAAEFLRDHKIGFTTRYSANWSIGGPIIEREKIGLFTAKQAVESWVANVARHQNGKKLGGWRIHQYGPTPLIAAMRCYVIGALGDTAEIPEELL